MEIYKNERITEDKIIKTCEDGFINYLVANQKSIWIDGKKAEILDVSKHPQLRETYPNVKPYFEIGDVIQELDKKGEVTITFDSGCCLFLTTSLPVGDSTNVEVNSNKSQGILSKSTDKTLKFEIKRIDFRTKYRNN